MDKKPATNDEEGVSISQQPNPKSESLIIEIGESDTLHERIQQSILHDTDDVYWAVKPDDHEAIFVNSAYETVVGGDADELRDDPDDYFRHVHPEDRSKLTQAFEFAREGRSAEITLRVNPDTDFSNWLSTNIRPVYDQDGELEAIAGVARDITDVKKQETKVRETKKRFQRILKHSSDVVVITDCTGELTYISPAIESQLGYDPQELIGGEFTRLFAPSERERAHRSFEFIKTRGEDTLTFELQGTTASGDTRWLEIQGTDYLDDPEINGVMLNIRDVTDRNTAENEVLQTQERYEEILRNCPDLVTIINEDLTISYTSPSVSQILGYTPGEWNGKSGLEFVHPDDREHVAERFRDTLQSAGKTVTEFRIRTADDNYRWIEAYAHDRTTDPDINGVLLFGRDITERKEREQKLRVFKQAVENAGHSISWTDPDGTIEYANPAFEEISGYDTEEVIGETHAILKSGVHDDEFYDELWSTIKSGETWRAELVNETKSGDQYVVNQTIAPITDENGDVEYYVAINDDITEQKEREQELRENKTMLEAITETGVEGLLVHDVDGNIKRWNTPFLDMWDISPRTAESASGTELIQEVVTKVKNEEEFMSVIQREYDNPEVETESTIELEDGRYFQRFSSPIQYEDGEFHGRVVAFRDITQIKERERQYKTLVDNLPGMVYRSQISEDWPLELVHGEYEELTGYTAQELLTEVSWGDDVLYGEDAADVTEETMEQLENSNVFEVTYRIRTKSGDIKWVREHGEKVDDGRLEGFITDITDQREYEAELEQQTDLFEKTEQIANVGGWEYNVKEEELLWTDEVKNIFRVSADFDPTLDNAFEFYEDEGVDKIKTALERARNDGEPYDLELPIVRENGDKGWIRTRGEPQFEDGELVRLRGAIQDITQQRRYKDALEGLNEAMAQLYNSEMDMQVAHTTVNIATDDLGVESVAVQFYNDVKQQLYPASKAGEYDQIGDRTQLQFNPGPNFVWQAYENNEVQVAGEHQLTAGGVRTTTDINVEAAIPIKNNGVLLLGFRDPEELNEMTLDLAELLASTTAGALERIEQDQELIRKKNQLEAHHDRLKRVENLNEEIREVMDSLVRAETRQSINQAVCEAVTHIDGFDYAWVGVPDRNKEKLQVQAEVGEYDLASQADLSLTEDNTLPAVEVARSGELQTEEGLGSSLNGEQWRSLAVHEHFNSYITIPLVYDDVTYAVLSVYSSELEGFDKDTTKVLADVGRLAGYAHNTVDQRGALVSGASTSLTIELNDYESVFTKVAAETGDDVTVEHLTWAADGQCLMYVTVCGKTSPDAVKDVFETDPRLDTAECISEGEMSVFELTFSETGKAVAISELGAQFKSATVRPGVARITVTIPSGKDTREFLNQVRDIIENPVSLHSKEQGTEASAAYQVLLRNHLTETQERVLKTAYHNGYFDKKRKRTGTAIAASLDISQPTFSNRLRTAQRNLLGAMYEPRESCN